MTEPSTLPQPYGPPAQPVPHHSTTEFAGRAPAPAGQTAPPPVAATHSPQPYVPKEVVYEPYEPSVRYEPRQRYAPQQQHRHARQYEVPVQQQRKEVDMRSIARFATGTLFFLIGSFISNYILAEKLLPYKTEAANNSKKDLKEMQFASFGEHGMGDIGSGRGIIGESNSLNLLNEDRHKFAKTIYKLGGKEGVNMMVGSISAVIGYMLGGAFVKEKQPLRDERLEQGKERIARHNAEQAPPPHQRGEQKPLVYGGHPAPAPQQEPPQPSEAQAAQWGQKIQPAALAQPQPLQLT